MSKVERGRIGRGERVCCYEGTTSSSDVERTNIKVVKLRSRERHNVSQAL